GETAEKASSLRTVLIVGGLAAAATVGVMLLVTRPSDPRPPVPQALPSASVATPLSVQPPPSAVMPLTSASAEAPPADSSSAAPPVTSASISSTLGSALRPRPLGSAKPGVGPGGDPYR